MQKVDLKGRPAREKGAKVWSQLDDFNVPLLSHAFDTSEILKEYGDRFCSSTRTIRCGDPSLATHAPWMPNCLAAQNNDAYWTLPTTSTQPARGERRRGSEAQFDALTGPRCSQVSSTILTW